MYDLLVPSSPIARQVNQILIASNMVGVCEGLLYAKKTGLNLEEVIKAVGAGAAGESRSQVGGLRVRVRVTVGLGRPHLGMPVTCLAIRPVTLTPP